jgi:glycopeptide antibiotics resistance protein
MKSWPLLLSILAVAPTGSHAVALAADLCGGTGGNGRVVSVGRDGFTIEPSGTAGEQIVHLTGRGTIDTSAGSVSLSDLKTGDRVTLVGGPNRDGSFSADTVVVCKASRRKRAGRDVPSGHTRSVHSGSGPSGQGRPVDSAEARAWSSYIDLSAVLLVASIWVGALVLLRSKRGEGLAYLLFFTVFYAYVVKVLDRTLFQFQSLLLLKHFAPNIILNGQPGQGVQLVPLVTLTSADVQTSLLNVLLMMPFGFGLPFITRLRLGMTVLAGALFSVAIESLQLITGLLGGVTFRIADINDVLFNTLGVAIGYALFVAFVRLYRRMPDGWTIAANPISRHIAERTQVEAP